MNDINIVVIDIAKKSIKKAKIAKNDLFLMVKTLEVNQIMIAKSSDNIAVFIRSGKIIGLQAIGSVRSIIESL